MYDRFCLSMLQLFFRDKVQHEEGYVLYVRKNALQILIPKYGLEGTIYLTPPNDKKAEVTFIYNEEVVLAFYLINKSPMCKSSMPLKNQNFKLYH